VQAGAVWFPFDLRRQIDRDATNLSLRRKLEYHGDVAPHRVPQGCDPVEGTDRFRADPGRGAELPDDETRTLDRPDGPVRLQFARRTVNVWQGEMIRIRIGEEPKKANTKGKVETHTL